MPERIFPTGTDIQVSYPNWGAIWAGMFTFVAIWAVFGVLGEAIFASAASPAAAHPVTGMSVGMGIWAVVLTIIAMFVAGRVTGSLSGFVRRPDAVMSGVVMFGLSVAATIIITVLAELGLGTGTAAAGTAHSAYVLSMFANVGWIGFFALILGWLAAMGGASSAVHPVVVSTTSQEVRRVA